MAHVTLGKDEILDAIGSMTVVELAELIEAFKTKFNVTIATVAAGAPAAGGAGGAGDRIGRERQAGAEAQRARAGALGVEAHVRRASSASTTARRSPSVIPTEHGRDSPLA